jgi:hypothetical protein
MAADSGPDEADPEACVEIKHIDCAPRLNNHVHLNKIYGHTQSWQVFHPLISDPQLGDRL